MHSWQMVAVGKSAMAKKGMLYAAKVMAGSAIDALEDPEIIRRAQEEFCQRTGGQKYASPYRRRYDAALFREFEITGSHHLVLPTSVTKTALLPVISVTLRTTSPIFIGPSAGWISGSITASFSLS